MFIRFLKVPSSMQRHFFVSPSEAIDAHMRERKYMLSRLLFVPLLCTLLAACDRPSASRPDAAATQTAAVAADDRVLIVSDPHLDPFDRREIVDQLAAAPIEKWETIFAQGSHAGRTSSYGHDSNAALILSAFGAMKQAIPHPSYILVAGDLFAHDFYRRFTWSATKNDDESYHRFMDKTADFLTYELTRAYPHTQIFPTVGNNDGYCGDYSSRPDEAYLAHQADKYLPLIDPEHRYGDIRSSFAHGGYYRAQTPSGLRIVSLNSVYFAKNYVNHCGDRSEQPGSEELGWMRGILAESHAPPTLILTHEPVGIDGFKTFVHLGFPVSLMRLDYQNAFLEQVNAAEHHVTAIITGHLHNVGYRQTHEGSPDSKPVIISPSVSPIFGNSPAFSIAYISKAGKVDDIEVHRLQSETAQAPMWTSIVRFNDRYHLHGVNVASIDELHRQAARDRRMRAILQRDSVGNAPALALMAIDWKALWCTTGALTPKAFLACEGLKNPPSHEKTPPAP